MINSAYGSSAVEECGQYLGVTTCGHDSAGEGAATGSFTKRAIEVIQAGSWEGPLKNIEARKEPLAGGAASSPSMSLVIQHLHRHRASLSLPTYRGRQVYNGQNQA
eukprot:16012723-Heterocapsa_arctica.AAC.1